MSVATNARWKRAMLFPRALFRSLVDTGSLFALGVEIDWDVAREHMAAGEDVSP